MRLIDGLTDHGLPENLGQGTRIPGFKPYFNFLRDHIFHKFSTRAYKNMSEKWDIGKLCLKIMLKLLKDYVPHVQEFNAGGGSMGFHIMTCLLQSSETLRLLLFLLDEGVGALESYQVSNCLSFKHPTHPPDLGWVKKVPEIRKTREIVC